jgi:hypothetical protein
MEKVPISQDDLLDVMEMTNKMETYISRILNDNELSLGFSALMSATINCMLAQCKTLDEIVFYRNLFMQIYDGSIRDIKIKEKD